MADFRREYQATSSDLAGMYWPEFHRLLTGLSDRSRFRQAWVRTPKHVYDQSEIDAVKAMARR